MSLYVDSDVITASDLTAIDSEAQLVADTQNPAILLENTIRSAVEACGEELKAKSQTFSGYFLSPGISVAHNAAVMNIGSTSINRPRFSLNQVVVSEPDPMKRQLKRWFVFEALYELYRASYQRFTGKNADRYGNKMDLYAAERDSSWENLATQGVPVVLIPLPCPGAIRAFEPGTWGAANLSAGGSGSTETGTIYDVAVTWVGAAYVSHASRGNAESGPSARAAIATAAGQVLTVSIASLNPPGSTMPAIGTAETIYTQMPAVGWNIWVGLQGQTLYLQNASPIAIGTTSSTLANAPVLSGSQCAAGQFSDYSFAFSGGMLWRA